MASSVDLLLLLLTLATAHAAQPACDQALGRLLLLANSSHSPQNNQQALTAVALFDSWGLLPTLLSFPRNYDYGKYDACRYISVQRAGTLPMPTHYCTAEIQTSLSPMPVVVGVCVPQVCTAGDIDTRPEPPNGTAVTTTSSSSPLVPILTARDDAKRAHAARGLITAVRNSYCGAGTAPPLPDAGAAVIAVLVAFAILAVAGACLPLVDWCRAQQSTGNNVNGGGAEKPLLSVAADSGEHDEEAGAPAGTPPPLASPPGPEPDRPSNQKTSSRCSCIMRALLQAFSLRKNYATLVKAPSATYISALDGVRVLSICWVIVGHGYALLVQYFPLQNPYDLLPPGPWGVSTRLASMFVPAGHFSVDSFFLLGGLLLVYVGGKRMKSWWAVPKGMLLRWIRLTPVLAVVLFFQWRVLPSMGSGPLWSFVGLISRECPDGWWKNLLYINNLDPWDDNEAHACMIHAWYLGTEFQLFIVGCALIVLAHSRRRLALFLLALLIAASVTVRLVLAGYFGYHESILYNMAHPPAKSGHTVANDLTYKPYAHASPYFLGMLVGFLLRDKSVVEWARSRCGSVVVGTAVPVGVVIISVLVYGLWPL